MKIFFETFYVNGGNMKKLLCIITLIGADSMHLAADSGQIVAAPKSDPVSRLISRQDFDGLSYLLCDSSLDIKVTKAHEDQAQQFVTATQQRTGRFSTRDAARGIFGLACLGLSSLTGIICYNILTDKNQQKPLSSRERVLACCAIPAFYTAITQLYSAAACKSNKNAHQTACAIHNLIESRLQAEVQNNS